MIYAKLQSSNPKRISPISIFSLTRLCPASLITSNLKKSRAFSVIYKEDFCQWISKKIGSTVSLGTNPDKQRLLWRRRWERKSEGTGDRGLLLCGHRGRRSERTLVCFTLLTGWSGLCNLAFDIYSANKNITSIVS